MAWTYNPALLAANDPLTVLRLLIEDVKSGDPQMQDEEILWVNGQFTNQYLAAAQCCRILAARYSRDVDTVQGELRILYSARQRAYASRVVEYQNLGMLRGAGAMPYAASISIAAKTNQVENTDRVPPQFNLGMDDNLLPIGPVGNQTPTPGLPDGSDDGSGL